MRVLLTSVAALALLAACNGEAPDSIEDAVDQTAETLGEAADEAGELFDQTVEAVSDLAGSIQTSSRRRPVPLRWTRCCPTRAVKPTAPAISGAIRARRWSFSVLRPMTQWSRRCPVVAGMAGSWRLAGC